MKIPRRRLSLETKVSLLLLGVAMVALLAISSSTRERLARERLPDPQARASEELFDK